MGVFHRAIDVTGIRFGKLTAVRRAPAPPGKKSRGAFWFCDCDCGRRFVAKGTSLRDGGIISCGCARGTHHGSNSPEYRIWWSMKQRCENPSAFPKQWKDYGGRGITVCDRWEHDFGAFYADMGPRPTPKHSIDRIDNDGAYSPENCRWATKRTQQNNMRSNQLITHDGLTLTFAEWARRLGMKRNTIYGRRYHGWPAARIVSEPVHSNHHV